MHFLILGGTGQLGLEWSSFLKKAGVSFQSFGSSEADITDERQIREVVETGQPDTIINCAAYTKVDQAEKERTKAEQVNARAVEFLAGYCAKKDIKLVHFSTDYVFPGPEEDKKRLPDGYIENHPIAPLNWYGATKLKGEEAIQESGVRYLIIRTSWLCGRYGTNFVKTMLKLSEEQTEINVINDQWGSPSFAENVIYNTVNLLKKDKEGIFNITTEGLISWFQLASEIFAIKGKEITLNPVSSGEFKTLARRPHFSKLNINKLRKIEGSEIWKWNEGLKKLLTSLNSG